MKDQDRETVAKFINLAVKDRTIRGLLVTQREFRELVRIVSPNLDYVVESYALRDKAYRERMEANVRADRGEW